MYWLLYIYLQIYSFFLTLEPLNTTVNMYSRLADKKGSIAVIGLGYVGLPLALELAKNFKVIGFDINRNNINLLNSSVDPSRELAPEAFEGSDILFTDNPAALDEAVFFEHYGIKPIRMIDLKSLMGDPSDNILGVKGIGEKTAIGLLQKYETLDGVYEHIDEIKGKMKEKLLADKDNAYFSYKLATIYKTIDFEYTFEDIKYSGPLVDQLISKYKELGFNSFLKTVSQNRVITKGEEYEVVKGRVSLGDKYSFYLELDGINYHTCDMIGASVYDGNKLYYFDKASLMLNSDILKNVLVTFDNKKNKY